MFGQPLKPPPIRVGGFTVPSRKSWLIPNPTQPGTEGRRPIWQGGNQTARAISHAV